MKKLPNIHDLILKKLPNIHDLILKYFCSFRITKLNVFFTYIFRVLLSDKVISHVVSSLKLQDILICLKIGKGAIFPLLLVC